MSRNVSILSVVVVMIVTVMATVAVAFATPNKGGSAQENGQGNSEEKVTICHKGHTITVGHPAVDAHLENHDVDHEGSCNEGPVPGPGDGTTPELTTEATAEATLPTGTISDEATLTLAPDGTDGNIVFRLYGPFTTAPTATDCTEANLVTAYGTNGAATVQVVDHTEASPPYTAPSFTPTAAGIYQWTAQFNSTTSGVDSTAEVGCGDATEQSVVN